MLIYRSSERTVSVAAALADLQRALESAATYDALVSILIDFGSLESGVADALCPAQDERLPTLDALRNMSRRLGRLVAAYWDASDEACWRREALQAIRTLRMTPLPARVVTSAPEGYAYYGVFPDMYLDAARRVARARRPRQAACIGLRSIGTSLSAMAQAGLENEGCRVFSATVRPRGNPFDRQVVFGPELATALSAPLDLVLVVDEGPGISGSSFAGTVRALHGLGIPPDRIVLLPTWDPDPAALRSTAAQSVWASHERVVADFDALWIGSGRLAHAFGAHAALENVSAGAWRKHLCAKPWPAVQPQHERRKYLFSDGERTVMTKFVGLGRMGDHAYMRMERLADTGFSPPPIALHHGFAASALCPGRPVPRGSTDPELPTRLAEYLAFVAKEFRTGNPANPEPLLQMIAVNTDAARMALPAEAARVLDGLSKHSVEAAALDARMLPHEWIATGRMFVKTDAADHHDDHFYPGPQDPAWDVAATLIEFALPRAAEAAFLDRYIRVSEDTHICDRLPFFRIGYLAFRLGYAMMAIPATDHGDDGPRWRRMRDGYAGQLQKELAACAGG